MGLIARIIAIVAGLAGGTIFSQAPEFAQQYRQRIGGAIDELRVIVEDFNAQAAEHHLDRQQALNAYAQSPDDFLRDRGVSMRSTITRYETLLSQQLHLGTAAPVAKPFILLQDADEGVLANTARLHARRARQFCRSRLGRDRLCRRLGRGGAAGIGCAAGHEDTARPSSGAMNQLAANAAWGNEDRTVFELIFENGLRTLPAGWPT